MMRDQLLRSWVREILVRGSKKAVIAEDKSLAGLGDTTKDSPFAGRSNGQMSFISEWAVYFASKNSGALTDAEWTDCQTDSRYSKTFTTANNLVSAENNASGPMAQNMQKVRAILATMKSQASDALSSLAAKGIDISTLPGNESKPKPGNDEIDVILKGVNIHVKLNDDTRAGGLARGKLTKGEYLSGYISSDIYFRALEEFVTRHILDESSEYRSKIVDVDIGGGKTKTFMTVKPDASSNISLGRSVIKLKTNAKGQPLTNKKDQPIFDVPTFELSREMINMGVNITDERFISLWERSKIGGPSVHVPDPSPKQPKRTGYGVELRTQISPKDLDSGKSYLRVTTRGIPYLLKDGQSTWTYEHYMDSGFGNMKPPGKDPAAKAAQAAYIELFKDKHDEFVGLLDTMGYKDAIVEDATRRLFGVELGKNSLGRETAYIKFTVPWPSMPKMTATDAAESVSIDSVFYPGIPDLRVVEEAAREGATPSIYYRLYGTGALKDKEIAHIKFRHFDSNRPPQVFFGKDSGELTQEVDIFSQTGGISSAMATTDVQRQLSRQPVHTATEYFQDKPEVRSDIVKSYLSDNNIVIQQGVEIAPVTRKDVYDWITTNWSNLKAHVPMGHDGAEDDAEAQTWMWAMIAQELKDLNILSELAVKRLGTIITENIIRRWVRKTLMTEQSAVI